MDRVSGNGFYYGEIKSGVLRVEHGKPCYVVNFVFDGIKDGKIEGGRSFMDFFYLSNNDGGRIDANIKSVMDVTGWGGADLRELKDIDPTGTMVWVPIKGQDYKGKTTYKATAMRKNDGVSNKTPASGQEFENIADAWLNGESYVASGAASKVSADDDVPF